MFGAILGDIVGSPYEFDRGHKTKNFELFTRMSHYTDDTVMTIAITDALLQAGKNAPLNVIRKKVIRCMQIWGRIYSWAGYGSRFRRWIMNMDPQPYGSYGNGSAMRVSPVGWLYDTIERTREVARATADVTHNHPEGIKGAEAVASVIFLARTGSTKQEIREYVVREFGYDLSRTCNEIRPTYFHVESCQATVPEAITAFMEGTNFEDVVRTAVSLGGDCDTLTDIAAAMAEAMYGIPTDMRKRAEEMITQDMKDILYNFEKYEQARCSKENIP